MMINVKQHYLEWILFLGKNMNENANNRKNLRELTLQFIWMATLVAMDIADLLVMLRATTTCVGTARSTVHFFLTASYLKAYYIDTSSVTNCTIKRKFYNNFNNLANRN